jgi:putative ABC transport system permease protein
VTRARLAESPASRPPAATTVSTEDAAILHWRPGQRVRAWLGDGTPATLRVIATFGAGLSGPALLLPRPLVAAHTPPAAATAGYVSLRRDALAATVMSELNRALRGTGTTVLTGHGYLQQTTRTTAAGENIGLTAILAVALLYAAIAVVNTLIMAIRERVRDLAQLRLAGATRNQALRTTAWEGTIIAGFGIALGLLVTAITIVAVPAALRHVGSAATLTVPWSPLLVTVAACLVLVLAPGLAAGSIALRSRPLDGMGIPE